MYPQRDFFSEKINYRTLKPALGKANLAIVAGVKSTDLGDNGLLRDKSRISLDQGTVVMMSNYGEVIPFPRKTRRLCTLYS